MPDPDLEITGGGGGRSSRPLNKGERERSPKNFFRPFGPQFGLNIRGEGPPVPPGSALEYIKSTTTKGLITKGGSDRLQKEKGQREGPA